MFYNKTIVTLNRTILSKLKFNIADFLIGRVMGPTSGEGSIEHDSDRLPF